MYPLSLPRELRASFPAPPASLTTPSPYFQIPILLLHSRQSICAALGMTRPRRPQGPGQPPRVTQEALSLLEPQPESLSSAGNKPALALPAENQGARESEGAFFGAGLAFR